jgi:hypothetical protein
MFSAALEAPPGRPRVLALTLLVWALVYTLVVQWSVPPPVRAADETPLTEFSAERAMRTLERLLGDAAPHPMGTPAAAVLRSRLLLELRGLELAGVGEQSVPTLGPYAVWATPKNVLARIDPPTSLRQPGDSILLACHYDSVAAGPGVADDLMGVAALLECARALKAAGGMPRPVLFLFTDGEEQGLLGAQAFVDSHAWRDEVGVTLNVEARGTSGPSLLFETGPDNAWLIEAFADSCAHAITTSLYYEAYRRLPNDTDFSVFKQAGHTGLNFANIENVRQYHTSLDSLANLDPASLQDHGDHLLGMTLALLGTNLADPPSGDAVYTHVFGGGIMVWSANTGRGLALFVLLWLFLALRRANHAGVERKEIVAAGLLVPAMLVCTVLTEGIAAFIAGGLGATGYTDNAACLARALLWCVGLTTTCRIAAGFRARIGDAALALGTWISWALLALFCALVVPGVSYLLLLPVTVLAVGALFFPLKRSAPPHALPLLVGVAVAALLWSDLQHGLEQGFGVLASSVHAAPVAFVSSLLAPLAPQTGRAFLRIVLALCVALLIALAIVPSHDAGHPAHLNVLSVYDDDARNGTVHVRAGGISLPAELAAVAEFEQPAASYPWSAKARSYQTAESAPAPAAPRFEVLESGEEDGGRFLRGRLSSPAGSWRTQFRLGAQEERRFEITIGDARMFTGLGEEREEELEDATFYAVPEGGLEIVLHVPDAEPLELFVIDTHLELSPVARAVAAARPAHCVPVGSGDRTLVFTRVIL